MAVQYDSSGRGQADSSNVAVTLGAGGLGGVIGARLVIDDAVITSKAEALLALESLWNAVSKQTWPAS